MEIDLVDPGRGVHPVDQLTVWATMHYPADERARQEFVAVLLAANLEKEGEFGELVREYERSASLSKADLARLPSLEDTTKRAVEAARYGGYVAGNILLYIVSAAETQPQDATVRRAIHAAGVVLARAKDANGRPIPASPASLKQAWHRFRSVSHFWAEFWIVADETEPTDFDPGRYETLPGFLAAAEEIRRRGEAVVPAGAQWPILDPAKTWRCPPTLRLPQLDLNLPGLVPEALAALKDYTHE